MLGVRRQTSSLALCGDTGQFPIIVLQKISVLKYWCHILSLPPESVVRRAYNTLIQLDRSGKQNWVPHVKSLLNDIQLFDHRKTQKIHCIKSFRKDVENYIKALFTNKWKHDISCSGLYPKLRSYATFKLTFHIEPYLLLLKKLRDVSALAKCRLSSHSLQIELGRHNNTPVNNRIWTRCDYNAVDDEEHFLIHCS